MIKLIDKIFYNDKEIKKELIKFIKNSNQFTMSKNVELFEDNFAKYQGRNYAVMVNSGASANLVLIQALKNLELLKNYNKIGISSLTWATNIMPCIQLNLFPVVFDIDNTLNIDVNKFENYIKNIEHIECLFITNALGLSCDLTRLKDICNENKIILIEDNCESLGSEHNGIKLGNFGLASTFSFFAGHHLSTIEGGMICTDDFNLYEMLKICRANGWTRNISKETRNIYKEQNNIDDFETLYKFVELGYNVRPTELNAIIGIQQLKYIDNIIKQRELNYKTLKYFIEKNNDFEKIIDSNMDIISSFSIPIICKTVELFEKYKKIFKNNNIEIRPLISGDITDHPFYNKLGFPKYDTEYCRDISKRSFYFANNPHLTKNNIKTIIECLK